MRRRLFLLFAVAVLLLVADGVYVLVRLNSTLKSAAESLEHAGEDLQEADLDAAQADFSQAFQDAEAAFRAQSHPAFVVARALPWVGNEATVVRALSQAGSRSAQAGLAGVEAARAMGAGGGELTASVYENGRVNFEAFERAGPYVDDAHRLLAEADSLLETSPQPQIAFIEDALERASREVDRATNAARKGSVLLEMLPGLLGEGSSRRYLLAFQTPSEARGTGGLIGLYGVLETRDGELRLDRVGGIDRLALTDFGSVQGPRWFRDHYGPLSALRQWQQANESPAFPVVSRILLRMYDAVYGEELDGVIAMDPVALERLMPATDPLQPDAIDYPITEDNAAKFLMHDAYVLFPNDRRQGAILASIVRDFWGSLRGGDVDAAALAKGVAEGVQTQHLKVYSNDAADQKALRTLGADGDYAAYGDNLQMVFHNNFAANKVDWFLYRRMETEIEITATGEARVETRLTMRNDAPPGPPNALLGNTRFNEYPPGTNGAFVNFMMPAEAQVYRFLIGGRQSPYILHRDGGYPVAWDVLKIPPGGTREIVLRYRVQGMLTTEGDDTVFRMTFFPQALVRPDDYALTITAPDGTDLIPEGADEDQTFDETYESSGKLDEPLTVSLRLRR